MAAAASASQLAARPWQLVGREEEARHVSELLSGPGAGHVVLAGTAGVGKTRLARELAEAAGRSGRPLLWATATRAARAVPLGALLSIIPESRRDTGDRLQLFREVVDAVGRLKVDENPALVVVDDAHLLDDASAALVLHLAVNGAASVLVTLRSGEPVPDPLVALWKDDLAVRIDVQALSIADTLELLQRTLEGPVDANTARRLFDASQGNVLLLREIVLSGVRSGHLSPRGGAWMWRGPFEVDARLIDVVTAALSIDLVPRALLTCLSLLERLPVEVALEIAGADAVVEAERQGLIVSYRDEGLGFRHPLFVDAHLARCGAVEVRQARHLLAALLERRPIVDGRDALRRSVFLLDAGQPVDTDTLVLGAQTALRLAEFELALRLARAADAATPSAAVRCVMADAFVALGRPADADAVLREELESGGTLDSPLLVRLALLHSQALHWGLADLEGAHAALTRWAELAEDPTARDIILAERAANLTLSGRYDEGREAAEILLAPENDERVRLRAFAPAAVVWVQQGHLDRTLALGGELLAAAVALADELPQAPSWVATQFLVACNFAGRLDEADRLLAIGRASPTPVHDEVRALRLMSDAVVLLARGRPRSAGRLLAESVAVLRVAEHSWRISWPAASLAEAAALCGDAALAGEAHDLAMSTLRPYVASATPYIERSTTWRRFADGELASARAAAADLADRAAARGLWTIAMVSRHDGLRLGAGRMVSSQLIEATERVDGPVSAAMGVHARGVQHGDGGQLMEAAQAFAGLGMFLYAAEAATHATDSLRKAGRGPDAAAAAAMAAEWYGSCEDAVSPVMGSAAAGGEHRAGALTARERELVALASQGLSNREIARRLVVSVRTVEGHLGRAYAKLGVHGREDLRR